MLIAVDEKKIIVSFIIIFGILSFPMGWIDSWVGLGWFGLSLSNTQICLLNRRTAMTAPLIHSTE